MNKKMNEKKNLGRRGRTWLSPTLQRIQYQRIFFSLAPSIVSELAFTSQLTSSHLYGTNSNSIFSHEIETAAWRLLESRSVRTQKNKVDCIQQTQRKLLRMHISLIFLALLDVQITNQGSFNSLCIKKLLLPSVPEELETFKSPSAAFEIFI